MHNTTFKLLLLVLSLLFTITPSFSEEIETLSIPVEDNENTFPYKLEIRDSDSKPGYGIVKINNIETKENKEYLISGKKEFSLPKGEYTATINSGQRRIINNFKITIPDKSSSNHIITIKAFANIEPTGWMMLDTYFNPSTPISKASLSNFSKALEVRAIYTPLNNILNNQDDFIKYYNKTDALLIPAETYLHKEFGEVISFCSTKSEASAYNPIILTGAIYPLLAKLKDLNNLTALSPKVFYKSKAKIISRYSEEFIFDTISGPLYDFILLDNFSSSLKIWHTLLNRGYRIPALYIGGNNFYHTTNYPTTKVYVKIPRKKYNQKFLHKTLKNGQSILSNGPFIRFFAESIGVKGDAHKTGQDNTDWINGHSLKIGDLGFTSENFRNIYAEAYSSSNTDDNIKSIELIYNGKIIEKKVTGTNEKTTTATWKVIFDKPGWIQLQYLSQNGKYHAVTNPIYLVDYNTTLPDPVLAKTEIQVLDLKTGKPVEARIIVENFGINIDKINIFKHPIVIQTPATANIRVEAKGYKNETKSIYLDGGAAKYIKALNNKKLLPKALISSVTYDYLKKALQSSKLIFKLKHK